MMNLKRVLVIIFLSVFSTITLIISVYLVLGINEFYGMVLCYISFLSFIVLCKKIGDYDGSNS